MSHTPKKILQSWRVKHHMPVLLHDKACKLEETIVCLENHKSLFEKMAQKTLIFGIF